MDTLAEIKVLLGMLLGGYSQSQITQATVSAYTDAVATYPVNAVRAAYEDYRDKKVASHDYRFPPTAPNFADRVRMHATLTQPRDPVTREVPEGCKLLPDGTIVVPVGVPFDWDNTLIPDGDVVDYGYGAVRLGGLTRREASVIDRLGGMTPDGKNFARLSIDEKRTEIARYLPAPVAA